METAENSLDPYWEFEVTAKHGGRTFLLKMSATQCVPWQDALKQFDLFLDTARDSFPEALANSVGAFFHHGGKA